MGHGRIHRWARKDSGSIKNRFGFSACALQLWGLRLSHWGIVQSAGRTQATRYFVDPKLLRSLQFSTETKLKRIEPHRLSALIVEDLCRYPGSAIGELHQRIGAEINPRQVKRALDALIADGNARFKGDKRWRRYWLDE